MSDETLIFRKPYEDYRRDFDYLKLWVEQNLTYAKIQDPQLDVEQYKQFLLNNVKQDGLFPVHNPRMKIIQKDENNDRQPGMTTMMDYLRQIVREDLRFAPTFTTYMPETRKLSLEACFLDIGMANRSKEKKLKFKAKERGDDQMAEYHDNMQGRLKVLNNSSSGAKASKGVVMYNRTGHSTLTSICRSNTSFANSINEKMLGGYYHYYNPEVTINNITCVLTYVDLNKVEAVMERYNLHYVTQEELLWAIKRSTDLYWRVDEQFQRIVEFVTKLTPLQCSAYLYMSDFYMIRQFNEEFVRNWMNKLLDQSQLDDLPEQECQYWIDKMDADLAALIVIYMADYCHGKSVSTALTEYPEIRGKVASCIKKTLEIFDEYSDLIQLFFVGEVMPFETQHVPDMMRESVLVSDTDSSLPSVCKNWVKWYLGEITHDPISVSLSATVIYIVSQHVAHVLGQMTGILNIEIAKRPLIAMKNEFLFSSFTTTPKGKHYFAKAIAQEGILFPPNKVETEIKGVGLKHTKVPATVTKAFKNELLNTMGMIERDEKISIFDLRYRLAKMEWETYQSIKQGHSIYLQRARVKLNESYKTEDNIYKRGHLFWEAVFADKYGHMPEPPYDAIKVSVDLKTKTSYQKWLDAIEDRNLVNRLVDWINTQNNGKWLTTFYIPGTIAQNIGIPDEIMLVIMPRKLVHTIVSPWYTLMEAYNIYEINDNLTRLVSDDFPQFNIPFSIDESD